MYPRSWLNPQATIMMCSLCLRHNHQLASKVGMQRATVHCALERESALMGCHKLHDSTAAACDRTRIKHARDHQVMRHIITPDHEPNPLSFVDNDSVRTPPAVFDGPADE